MIAHAQVAFPQEACGLVAFDHTGRPVEVFPVANASGQPDRFVISPAEYHRVLEVTQEQGWEVGGLYHSHPHGPARPSRVDLSAGRDPEWVTYIVGRPRLLRGFPTGWRVRRFAAS